ncbi:MAG: protein kinase, partial [Acidobacteriia bacterium]|nr:protein kinase [Terriglobia bacterium]
GAGGMGVVFKALDLNLQRTVALKFLTHIDAGAAVEKERLLREARAASALDHPNIAAVYTVQETSGGRLCKVMAYYGGGTLALAVPLARRKLVEVTKVTMNGPSMARVEYIWKWEPTPVGDLFDANGQLIKSFNLWDTQALIEKYGANFYHGDAKKVAVNLVKTDQGAWQLMSE